MAGRKRGDPEAISRRRLSPHQRRRKGLRLQGDRRVSSSLTTPPLAALRHCGRESGRAEEEASERRGRNRGDAALPGTERAGVRRGRAGPAAAVGRKARRPRTKAGPRDGPHPPPPEGSLAVTNRACDGPRAFLTRYGPRAGPSRPRTLTGAALSPRGG